MKLERAMEMLEGRDLDAALSHWNQERHAWPVAESDRRLLLRRALTDPREVELQLSRLPSKLRDFLVFVIRLDRGSRPFDVRSFDAADLPVAPIELVPVSNALLERSFFAAVRSHLPGRGMYAIPEELCEVLQGVIDGARRPVDATLSLGAHLRFIDRRVMTRRLEAADMGAYGELRTSEVRDHLAKRDAWDRRVEMISDPDLRSAVEAFSEHGGVIDGETRRRLDIPSDPELLESWGKELEELLLGGFEQAELTNNGISCRVGWLVVFDELVTARLRELVLDEEAAAEDVRRAPDAVADLRAIVADLEASPLKVKRSGELYKGGLKRLQKAALTPGARLRGAEEDLLFLIGFLRQRDLIAGDSDGIVRATKKWRPWSKKEIVDQVEDLLAYARAKRVDDCSMLHHGTLRDAVVEALSGLEQGQWIHVAVPVIETRNAYLREAVRPEHAARYQDRHKHAPFPMVATPDGMLRALTRWIVDALARLGIVEVAVRDDEPRPWALRLTRLGAVVFGVEEGAVVESDAGALVVNPDHEIVVFPDRAGPQLVQAVGRFAMRVKADYALHYTLTRESVQEAAAGGLTADEILETLDASSRHAVPDNVRFSIEEWCERVVRLEARRSHLLQAPDTASLDRLLEIADFAKLVRGRLSDTTVELAEDPTQSGIVALLRDRGFYL